MKVPSLTEELAWLKKTYKDAYKKWCTQWLLHAVRNPDKTVLPIAVEKLRVGGLYFMRYDLGGANKTNKLEQFTPLLLVDYQKKIDARVVYALNLNFLTTQKKEAFFARFAGSYTGLLEANAALGDVGKEQPFPSMNYERMFRELVPFAFEYALREYRLDLVQDMTAVSTAHLAKFISLDTHAMTGVDETKLNDIWIAKLKKEGMEQRVLDVVAVKSNYEKILAELAEKFKRLEKGF